MAANTGARRRQTTGESHVMSSCCVNWMVIRNEVPDRPLMTRYKELSIPVHQLGEPVPILHGSVVG